MATHQWLSRAPIVEAVVHLSAVLADDARSHDARDLGALPARLAERYPHKERRIIDAGARGHGESYRLTGSAPYVVQASLEAMTCSRLAPYGGFGPLIGEALWAWEHYLEVSRPARIFRIAVRFLNRFEVPLPLQLDRLFLTGPRIAPSLPQTVSPVESRIILQCGADTQARIAQRIEPAAEGLARVCLDVEVHRAVSLPPDSHLVWQGLGELAAIEHHVFFESVTDEALAPYV